MRMMALADVVEIGSESRFCGTNHVADEWQYDLATDQEDESATFVDDQRRHFPHCWVGEACT